MTIPMEPSNWEMEGTGADFVTHLGETSLKMIDGGADGTGANIVRIKDLAFKNGTIEYDIALTDKTRFTTVYFRQRDRDNTEHVYLRANAVGQPKLNSAIQYAAVVDGVNYWDLSPLYQSNADLKPEGFNHVKVVVRDRQLLAYVNDMENPALYIPEMDGEVDQGSIGFDGTAFIANVTINASDTGDLPPGKGYDVSMNDSRYLLNWQVGEPMPLPPGTEPTGDHLPGENSLWSPIIAERLGLINLSRRFGATPRGERRMVWLRTTITADKDQQRSLDLGFSDEVLVLINGAPLYVDKNLFGTPGMKTPRGRLSPENTNFQLPLRAGENELLIGVTNFFFGWGIVARLDDAGGLSY